MLRLLLVIYELCAFGSTYETWMTPFQGYIYERSYQTIVPRMNFARETYTSLQNVHRAQYSRPFQGYVYERPQQSIVPTNPILRKAPPMRRTSENECLASHFNRIFGGDKTTPGEFPHMAALGWKRPNSGYDYHCGGTLISNRFVLTAAHCLSSRNKRPDVALLGGGRLNDPSSDQYVIGIENVIVHRQYKRKEFYNDIALIMLRNKTGNLPACLWPQEKISVTRGTAIGYGQTNFGLDSSNDLLKADVSIFPDEFCRQFYGPRFKLSIGFIDSQFCAGDLNKQRDTCPGDSGGPLLTYVEIVKSQIPHVLGVISFGSACAQGIPGVYTKLYPYLDWIESVVWPKKNLL